MSTIRNKTKKDTNKKTKESSKQTTNKQMSSSQVDGVDSKIPSYFPVSPQSTSNKDQNDSSTSCSDTLIPTRTMPDSSLHTDEEKNSKQTSISEHQSKKTEMASSTSKDEKPGESREHGQKNDGNSRPLKQMLLSPKRSDQADSVPVKTNRQNKSRSSKGTKQSDITKHFPVRRSQRKVKSKIEEEKQKSLEKAVLEGKEEGIEIRSVEGKGRGVFAIKPFQRGDFVCEYHGEHIDYETAKEREKKYSEDEKIGCYMYYFSFNNKKYCVDATQESGRLGRLLNHSINGNCTTKLIAIKDKPYLILVAAKDIQPGYELLYDYGERNKDAIASHPWLQA